MAKYQTLAESQNTSEGLHTLFVYANDVTGGLFTNMLLLSLFLISLMATYFSVQRLTGDSDFPGSFAVASYITVGLAVILTLVEGLISLETLVIAISISIIGTIWLFFSRA